MSSRLVQILLALSLLLNTFVLAGFVYSSWIASPSFDARLPPRPPPGSRPNPVEALTHDLDLDGGQRAAVSGLLSQYAVSRRERLRELQKVREETAAELKRPDMDMARIDMLVDQIAKLRTDQHKEMLHTVFQLEPHLRPDQRERLRAVLAERFAGSPQPPRPPGGAPGAPGAPGRPSR
jgi:Spy/CpxP family protein refolding chaperone